ncbi:MULTISPECIES: hypothetical protein [Corynebacterium]
MRRNFPRRRRSGGPHDPVPAAQPYGRGGCHHHVHCAREAARTGGVRARC